VTGLRCDQVAADVSIFVPGRRLDDNGASAIRLRGRAGMLWASQVATGNENNLRLRIYGEKAGIEWGQENPNYLRFTPYGKPPTTISRAGAGATASAKHASRIPSGHSGGILGAFAQLYADLAEQIAHETPGALRRSRRCWYRAWRTASLAFVSSPECWNLLGKNSAWVKSAVVPVGRESRPD